MNWKFFNIVTPSEAELAVMREQQKARVDRSKQPHPVIKIINIITGREALEPKRASDGK